MAIVQQGPAQLSGAFERRDQSAPRPVPPQPGRRPCPPGGASQQGRDRQPRRGGIKGDGSLALNSAEKTRGYILIELLIYIAVLAVVMEVAFSAFYRCLGNTRDLARNADDILKTLAAGEAWRADIRLATGPLETVTQADLTAFE